MAVTLTATDLASAIRIGSSAEETAQATRLLAYAAGVISRHLGTANDDAPEAVVNEAAIRLAGYLYDQPTAAGGASFANGLRNSSAAAMLLAYRVHRAGSVRES